MAGQWECHAPNLQDLGSPLPDLSNQVLFVFVLFLVLSKIDEIQNQYLRCVISRARNCNYKLTHSIIGILLLTHAKLLGYTKISSHSITLIFGQPCRSWFSALTQHNYKLTHSVDGIPLLTHIRPKNALRSETEGLFLLLKKSIRLK